MYQPITYSLLKSINTCQPQLDLVEKHFGKIKPIPLTKEIAIKFGSLFNIDWAANHLLTKEDYEDFMKFTTTSYEEYTKVRDPAYEEYIKVIVPAMKEYNKVTKPAREEYMKVRAPALKKYMKVRAPALKKYNKVNEPALKKYNKFIATEFVRIYKQGMK